MKVIIVRCSSCEVPVRFHLVRATPGFVSSCTRFLPLLGLRDPSLVLMRSIRSSTLRILRLEAEESEEVVKALVGVRREIEEFLRVSKSAVQGSSIVCVRGRSLRRPLRTGRLVGCVLRETDGSESVRIISAVILETERHRGGYGEFDCHHETDQLLYNYRDY